MKSMPYSLKQKLRQYDSAQRKAHSLHDELVTEFAKYNVPYDNLTGNAMFGDYPEEMSSESLAFINNCEGNIEENIEAINEVFIHFVNKK